MRKTFVALTAMTLVGSAAMFVAGPRLARAQGGGAVEVDVKYNGAPVVEKLKVNKDTEKCGTETTALASPLLEPTTTFSIIVSVPQDRKSTRLNSSHDQISYAVFCLKKKKNITPRASCIGPSLRGNKPVASQSLPFPRRTAAIPCAPSPTCRPRLT